MNLIKIIVSSMCCLICFWACKPSGDRLSSDAIFIPYDKEKPKMATADLFSNIKFVPLETNEDCFIADGQQVLLYDSLVFLCDNYRLFLFDDDGKFISRIGREGLGPGEYVGGFRGFFVDMKAETVNIIYPVNRSIMVYDFGGTYLHSEAIPPDLYNWGYVAMPVEGDKLFIFNSHNPGNNMAYTLMDRNDPDKVSYFCTYDPVKIKNYTYHFATHPMTRFNNLVHFTMPLDPFVYEYSDGGVRAVYHIETPSEVLPKDVMQKKEGTYLPKLVDLTMQDYFGGFTNIFETDDRFFIHYMAMAAYPGLYVMDKNKHTGSYYTFPSTGDRLVSPIFPFSASDGNRMISIVPLREILKLKDYIAENAIEKSEMSAQLRNALEEMDEDGNPLMVIYDVSSASSNRQQ